ncbi:MAG: YdcF family protein [Anaerolineaceae bacterium]|nr:YdcF family protein [Anaerolineaceae bacterium]
MKRVISFLKSRRFRRVVLVLVFLFILFEVGLAAVIHLYGLPDRTQPADVIIVLGAGLYMIPRAEHAAVLWKKDIAPNVICTGGFTELDSLSEAEACNVALQMAGVPADVIIKEENSRNTEENALETRKIMGANGWQTAVIVSDGYHLLRASWLFNRVGIENYPSPVSENPLPARDYIHALLREMAAVHWQAFEHILNTQPS